MKFQPAWVAAEIMRRMAAMIVISGCLGILQYSIKQPAGYDAERNTDLRKAMKSYGAQGLNGHGNVFAANQIGELFSHHCSHGNSAAIVWQLKAP